MDMEVAGQWRQQWAGTAEYGKVTEGGVSRRVARAMEVMHASTEGARVRVMRAAYHSSAGPGTPAASFLMHSSRRVISSRFNLLESPSVPIKPLEISSTPFESSPEYNTGGEDYKVTEPDDIDISEPSKWMSANGEPLIRMPSEESSSTADNVSIIDLDSRNHKNVFRKYSYDSDNSDLPSTRRNSSRTSPLLDAPVALSTLKYKSLLNGSNDWTNRRKSYSFEDTSPLNETIIHNNDTLAMESSTDSGICKSTEIVNDTDDKFFDRKEKKHDDTFKEWLSKHRSTPSFYKGHKLRPQREHSVVIEEPSESSISLQSQGKVTFTIPIKIADDYQYKDDDDRKAKRVEFCKTELHFAAETGRVNIIATDEKPPPTNDFRKRRSAFVPIHGTFDKLITLFGDNSKDFPKIESDNSSASFSNSEIGEFDENTAATKSILKNKIPKPKPYLLGENMVFGDSDPSQEDNNVPTAVALINKPLQKERRFSKDAITSLTSDTDPSIFETNTFRTINTGPLINASLKIRKKAFEVEDNSYSASRECKQMHSPVKSKILQMSPIPGTSKTRQLRNTDLTYFGINNYNGLTNRAMPQHERRLSDRNDVDDSFRSVRLIQQVSNSVCNSEAESEDAPYENLAMKTIYVPVPAPRKLRNYDSNSNLRENTVTILKLLNEQDSEDVFRRARLRKQDENTTFTNRSISEPPKLKRHHLIDKSSRRFKELKPGYEDDSAKKRSEKTLTVPDEKKTDNMIKSTANKNKMIMPGESKPLYVNLNVNDTESKNKSSSRKTEPRKSRNNIELSKKSCQFLTTDNQHSDSENKRQDKQRIERVKPHLNESDRESLYRELSIRKKRAPRTEKLSTPEHSNENDQKIQLTPNSRRKATDEKIYEQRPFHKSKHEYRSRSSHRKSTINKIEHKGSILEEAGQVNHERDSKPIVSKRIMKIVETKHRTRTPSKDKVIRRNESPQPHLKLDSKSTDSYRNSSKTRKKEVRATEKIPTPKADSYNTPKRSEYVINYDDKNGAVSSICKVRPGSGSNTVKFLKETSKERPKEYKTKTKMSEKKNLLQSPDDQWNPYEVEYADKKTKKRMHVQRTCQIL